MPNLLISNKQSSRHHLRNRPVMTSDSPWIRTWDDAFDVAFEPQNHSNGKAYDCIAFYPGADSDIGESTNIIITEHVVQIHFGREGGHHPLSIPSSRRRTMDCPSMFFEQALDAKLLLLYCLYTGTVSDMDKFTSIIKQFLKTSFSREAYPDVTLVGTTLTCATGGFDAQAPSATALVFHGSKIRRRLNFRCLPVPCSATDR